MTPDDYFFMEEFIFPEQGGITGEYQRNCPFCDVLLALEVDAASPVQAYRCCQCDGEFYVDWNEELWG